MLQCQVELGGKMKRRELIVFLGGAAAWPLAARGQQHPVVGFLSAVSQAQTAHLLAAFRRGLTETGLVEGKNVLIEYRFADGQYDRLPAQATDLVRRSVNVIVASGPPAANAARVATTAIPIVFVVDSIRSRLVSSIVLIVPEETPPVSRLYQGRLAKSALNSYVTSRQKRRTWRCW